MASRGWYAEKLLKLKKETSKQRKESMSIHAINEGNMRKSGTGEHSYDSKEEVYARMLANVMKRVAAI